MQLARKQADTFKRWLEGDEKYHFYHGGTRSMKTDTAVLETLHHSLSFKGMTFLLIALTVQSARRNFRLPLQKYAAELGLKPPRSWQANPFMLGDNYFEIAGIDRPDAVQKIFGSTVGGILIDEATRLPSPETVFPAIFERTGGVDDARIILAMNPGSPRHWLRTFFLKEFADQVFVQSFAPWENPFLTPQQLAEMQKMRVGAEKRRLWDGDWVAQDGAIYPDYDIVEACPITEPDGLYLSVDPGSHDAFAAGCYVTNEEQKRACKVDEYYKGKTNLTVGQHLTAVRAMVDAVQKEYDVEFKGFLCDRSARTTRIELQKYYNRLTYGKDLYDGIVNMQTRMVYRELTIHARCEETISEMDEYVWDDRGGDTPAPGQADHAMDETRYFCSHFWPLLTGGASVISYGSN